MSWNVLNTFVAGNTVTHVRLRILYNVRDAICAFDAGDAGKLDTATVFK